jgi:ATP-dependent Clp protease ATP-binding subunit ClpA
MEKKKKQEGFPPIEDTLSMVKSGSKGLLLPLEQPPHLIGRDEEVEFLYESLHKKRMKNSVLVGEAGVGKTVIVESLAEKLKGKVAFLEFSSAACVAGTHYRGDFEQKVIMMIRNVTSYNKQHPTLPLYLFIDEIHTIYKAGIADDDTLDIGNIFKPYLADGRLTVIGATTPKEYEDTIQKDQALSRRLSPIYVPELPKEAILPILKEFSEGKLDDHLIETVYQESLALTGYNPDKSLEIIDRALAKNICTGEKIDAAMIAEIVHYLHWVTDPRVEEDTPKIHRHCSL